jgi:hypothetical protein
MLRIVEKINRIVLAIYVACGNQSHSACAACRAGYPCQIHGCNRA